jgi:hypothetical protein
MAAMIFSCPIGKQKFNKKARNKLLVTVGI